MSSDHSDGELSPASPAALDDEMIMVPTQWSRNLPQNYDIMINSRSTRLLTDIDYLVKSSFSQIVIKGMV